jgi:SAM-dependent methyltransferase
MSKWDDFIIVRAVRKIRREMRNFFSDAVESLTVKTEEFNEFNPPKRLRRLVGGEKGFDKIGEEFLEYFTDLCKLKPNERILDVGCGVGRVACSLTTYLDQQGSYEGVDIVKEAIDWDNKMITSKFPNFHFQLADIYNKSYNLQGKLKASEYKFPYESGSFDFVFLTSVFTHMLPQDMENYVSEIARVLKPGCMCLVTFFLLNAESINLIESKLSSLEFQYKFERYRTISRRFLESAIAFDEKLIRELYLRYGLHITEPIHYGAWSGRKNHLSYQDIIIAVKKGENDDNANR